MPLQEAIASDTAAQAEFVDAATILRLTPMSRLIAAIDEAFRTGSASPRRQAYDLPEDGTLLVMPAWRSGGDTGVKVVTVLPNARPAVRGTYLLIDGRNGRLKAILDGTMLTPRRTAAASALACDRLARRDARTLLMIGTGTLAPHLVEAHASVRTLASVLVWGRDSDKAGELADSLRRSGYPAIATTYLDRAIGQADIISAATLSTRALIKGELVRTGTHIDLVGAFRPDMSEADPTCFERAKVFVDTREGVLEEAGDLLQAIAVGAFSADAIIADLAGLCQRDHPGRCDEREITMFKSVGVAMEDLVTAELVYSALHDVGSDYR